MHNERRDDSDSVVNQYTRQAREYARSDTHSDDKSLTDLVRFASLSPGALVLDVATGTGFTAFAFAAAGCRVTGLDLTTAMLFQAQEIAAQRGLSGVRWVRSRAETLPFGAGTFQGITCRLSCHHFSDVPSFLNEVQRVLEPGGALIIADTSSPDDAPESKQWFERVESIRDPSHQENYSPSRWKEMAEEAGLKVTGLDYALQIRHSLSTWAARAGASQERLRELHELFTRASHEVKSFFAIEQNGEEVDFSWPVVRLKAVKQ